MKRRTFVKASLLTPTVANLLQPVNRATGTTKAQPNASPEFYELRLYTLKNAKQRKLVETYFQQAAIPALNRLGSNPIGVFTEYLPQGFTKLLALIPLP